MIISLVHHIQRRRSLAQSIQKCTNRHIFATRSIRSSSVTLGASLKYDSSSLVTFTNDNTNKIGYITLNSPSTYNALSVEMGREFESLVHDLTMMLNDQHSSYQQEQSKIHSESESSIRNTRVIILKGAKQNFSSGGDLSWLRDLRNNPAHVNADYMYSFYKSFLSIRSLPIPTIAHVEGYAIGAGACLALATDLRIMDQNAKIGFNFVKLGIHSGMGGSHLLSNVIGESRSKMALLTGKVFNAQEALHNGIANDISTGKSKNHHRRRHEYVTDDVHDDQNNGDNDDDDHDDVVINVAKQIAAMHPLAIRSMVQTTRMREDAMGGVGGLDATMRREAYAQALCYAKSDWGEGLDAVLEQRQPDFSDYHDDGDW